MLAVSKLISFYAKNKYWASVCTTNHTGTKERLKRERVAVRGRHV